MEKEIENCAACGCVGLIHQRGIGRPSGPSLIINKIVCGNIDCPVGGSLTKWSNSKQSSISEWNEANSKATKK